MFPLLFEYKWEWNENKVSTIRVQTIKYEQVENKYQQNWVQPKIFIFYLLVEYPKFISWVQIEYKTILGIILTN